MRTVPYPSALLDKLAQPEMHRNVSIMHFDNMKLDIPKSIYDPVTENLPLERYRNIPFRFINYFFPFPDLHGQIKENKQKITIDHLTAINFFYFSALANSMYCEESQSCIRASESFAQLVFVLSEYYPTYSPPITSLFRKVRRTYVAAEKTGYFKRTTFRSVFLNQFFGGSIPFLSRFTNNPTYYGLYDEICPRMWKTDPLMSKEAFASFCKMLDLYFFLGGEYQQKVSYTKVLASLASIDDPKTAPYSAQYIAKSIVDSFYVKIKNNNAMEQKALNAKVTELYETPATFFTATDGYGLKQEFLP